MDVIEDLFEWLLLLFGLIIIIPIFILPVLSVVIVPIFKFWIWLRQLFGIQETAPHSEDKAGQGVGRARISIIGDALKQQRKRQEEQERRAQEETRLKTERERAFREEKERVGRERSDLLDKPVPPDVQRSMRAFLSGEFFGEDRSPLAYVGYRVGKTNGLAPWDRQRRLEICFRMDIPSDMPSKYKNWGSPASLRRFEAIAKHLRMLADMRRSRANQRFAVADWDADEEWFQEEFNSMARRFGQYGFAR